MIEVTYTDETGCTTTYEELVGNKKVQFIFPKVDKVQSIYATGKDLLRINSKFPGFQVKILKGIATTSSAIWFGDIAKTIYGTLRMEGENKQ